MEKRNWRIVYSSYEGMEKKAVELLYKEMGALTLRNSGVYTIYVLPCVQEKVAALDQNAVVVGLYHESAIIQKYIQEDEIAADGDVVKVMNNPENEELKLVLITAKEPCALFYGARDFVDDYFPIAAPRHGALKLVHEIFEGNFPDYYNASAPAVKTRCVFTCGHPINDYRDYIENMARLKLNQLIIWNDYAPLNAKDIISYAHEFGIQVIWGYAWGWQRHCAGIDLNEMNLELLAEKILNTYEEQYADLGGDGIYFQSFTELNADKFGDKLVAEVVTDFVNDVAGRLLEKHPNLLLQFGLHATSVKDHLPFIAKVDPRVEIMWEDCGTFPYGYHPIIEDEEKYRQTMAFTDEILTLREEGRVSMLFKGFMTLDWHGDRFAHQAGPYVMGLSSPQLVKQDIELLKPIWRQLQSGWLQYGRYAYEMAKHIYEHGNKETALGLAGQFAGGIWLPEALCAQILWECDRPYEEIFNKVTRRKSIEIV